MQTHHMTDHPTTDDHVLTARVWARAAVEEYDSRVGELMRTEESYHWVCAVDALLGPLGEMR